VGTVQKRSQSAIAIVHFTNFDGPWSIYVPGIPEIMAGIPSSFGILNPSIGKQRSNHCHFWLTIPNRFKSKTQELAAAEFLMHSRIEIYNFKKLWKLGHHDVPGSK